MQKRHAEIEKLLKDLQLVPVVSLPSVEAGMQLAEILIRCNLPVVEVTFRTSCAAAAIASMKKEHDQLLVLAGTILTPEQAGIAHDSGAECIVTPGFHFDLVTYCQTKRMMVCPGTTTPTEVLQCLHMGLRILKFFPAEVVGGVAMIEAMASVFQDIRFMPTGGVNPQNVIQYLSLKSVLCCGGSWLAPEELMRNEKWDEIAERISNATSLIKAAKF